jgi:hypothetical protein
MKWHQTCKGCTAGESQRVESCPYEMASDM